MLVRTSKDKNHPYVMINREFLDDRNLSLKAKGLLTYCMSKPDGWSFHIQQMSTVLKEGRDAIRAAFKELIKYGYCIRQQHRSDKGEFDNIEYILYEVPIQGISPQTENPATDMPGLENPALVSNEATQVSNKTRKKEQAASPSLSLVSFGSNVKLIQKDYDDFVSKYGKEFTDGMIAEINDWIVANGKKDYKCYAAAVRNWIRKKENESKADFGKKKTSDNIKVASIKENVEIAKETAKSCKSKNYSIEVLSKYVEICPKGAGQVECLSYNENGFKEQLENILRKRGFERT